MKIIKLSLQVVLLILTDDVFDIEIVYSVMKDTSLR